MGTAHVRRNSGLNKAKEIIANRKKSPPKEEKMEQKSTNTESASRFFTFTIDANTAQIVKLESQDASGARHELSDEEKANLTREGGEAGVETVLEQAFEAGIACVLGDGVRTDKGPESAEDAELRRLLLLPLIEHSPAKRFLQREFLNRAILATLIEHSAKPAPPASAPGASGEQHADSARAH
jgi:hypothetical protein